MSTDLSAGSGFTTSPQIDLITAALAKAQAAFGSITKDKTAKIQSTKGNYDYSYASLPDVIAAIRPALNAQELTILQPVVPYGRGPAILSILGHSSGQWMQAVTPFEMPAGTAQQQGSAVTYWRRYSLQALLCVASEDEDDDGAAASAVAPPRRQSRPATSPRPEPAPRPADGNGNSNGSRNGRKATILETIQARLDAAEKDFHAAFPDSEFGWELNVFEVERHLLGEITGETTQGMSNGEVRRRLLELSHTGARRALYDELLAYLARALELARHAQIGESDPEIDYEGQGDLGPGEDPNPVHCNGSIAGIIAGVNSRNGNGNGRH